MPVWSANELLRDGQTDWLVRLYENTVNSIRDIGGMPSSPYSIINIEMPSMERQADVMRYRDQLPPGHNAPTGVLDWLE